MTMRYTHIGLDDQAKAVAAIPAPRTAQPEEESWEYIGSKTVRRTLSFAVIGWQHGDHGTGHR